MRIIAGADEPRALRVGRAERRRRTWGRLRRRVGRRDLRRPGPRPTQLVSAAGSGAGGDGPGAAQPGCRSPVDAVPCLSCWPIASTGWRIRPLCASPHSRRRMKAEGRRCARLQRGPARFPHPGGRQGSGQAGHRPEPHRIHRQRRDHRAAHGHRRQAAAPTTASSTPPTTSSCRRAPRPASTSSPWPCSSRATRCSSRRRTG